MKLIVLALLALFTAIAFANTNAPLNVTITGVKDLTGNVRVAIFNSADSFQKEPHLALVVPADAETISFEVDDLAVGEYAIMLFHDVDDNEKMKTNLVGMPREPWGASLQGKSLFGPPKWKDVMFEHTADGTALTISLN